MRSGALEPVVVRRVLSYSFAAAVVAIALALKTLSTSLGEDHPFLLLPTAVILATWYGGGGPGLFATALAALATDALFIPPLGLGTTPSGLVALVVLLLEGFVIVFVTDSLREARRQATAFGLEADRDRRATSFALTAREELLGLWAQKLSGPLAHVRESSRETRKALETGDRDGAIHALERLERDVELIQRTTHTTIPGDPQLTALG